MKKRWCMLLLGLCLILMSGCGDNIEDMDSNDISSVDKNSIENESNLNEQSIKSDENEENKTQISNIDGVLIIDPGIYNIGNYIMNTDYLLVCEDTDYSMQVTVFENKEAYNNYKNAKRATTGEELAAIEQNALYDYHLKKGEIGYLSFDNDYVLLIDNGSGRVKEISESEANNRDLYRGTYFVGDDLKTSSYLLTCEDTEYSMHIFVFENKEAYKTYHQTSRFTNGEESAAIEQNALYDYYLESEETGYLSLEEDYVLVIDDGKGKVREIDINSSWYSGDNEGLHRGIYFVGNDLEAAQYSLTCIDSFIEVIVFEDIDAYIAYQHSSRFTGGEEEEAIELNARSSEYVYGGDSMAINLQEGNILLIKDGIGDLQKFSR